jgi:hypothetical protein
VNGPLYTCFIDKIVARSIPKINYIGSLIIDFIRIECLSKDITLITDKTEVRKMDILYLYSLTASIPFYKKNPNIIEYPYQFHADVLNDEEMKSLSHVFIILSNELLDNVRKFNELIRGKKLLNFSILHTFEVNSTMDSISIQNYIDHVPDEEKCNTRSLLSLNFLKDMNIYTPYLLHSKRRGLEKNNYHQILIQQNLIV